MTVAEWWKWVKKRVDPTYRKMAVATELFVSRPTFEPI